MLARHCSDRVSLGLLHFTNVLDIDIEFGGLGKVEMPSSSEEDE